MRSGLYIWLWPFLFVTVGQADAGGVLRHNPFQRPTLERMAHKPIPGTAMENNLTLRATLAGGADSLANINGQMFRLGDRVGGYQIKEINEGNAVLFRSEQVRRLTVHNEKVE